jgi:hypothetical protein
MVDRYAEFLRLAKALRAMGATSVADGELSCAFTPVRAEITATAKATTVRVLGKPQLPVNEHGEPVKLDPDAERRRQYALELGEA